MIVRLRDGEPDFICPITGWSCGSGQEKKLPLKRSIIINRFLASGKLVDVSESPRKIGRVKKKKKK